MGCLVKCGGGILKTEIFVIYNMPKQERPLHKLSTPYFPQLILIKTDK